MLDAPVLRFNASPLIPFYGHGKRSHVNLPPNTIYPKGTILGQVTSSANDVQTITITGTPTGGSFTITVSLMGISQTTTPLAFNASTAAVQSALQALTLVGANVAVTGTAGTSYVLTFNGNLAASPIPPVTVAASLTGGATPAATPVHTTTGRTAGTYAQYASGNSDGSQVPKCITEYDCATDSSGQISLGALPVGGQWGETFDSIPAYFTGDFATTDLVNLDANAVTAWGAARLLTGTVASGILHIA
jgi:hypothetical protein